MGRLIAVTSSAARCDRILALIDACLDDIVEASAQTVRESSEVWGQGNVIQLRWRDYSEAFSTRPA